MSARRAAKPPCARCGRVIVSSWARWPGGYLCSTCRTHALETYGPCAGCGASRLTPGIAPDGGRLCTGCAGGLGDFTCPTCGREGILYRRGACGNCVLAEMLAVLLDDGTGRIRPELAPFADAFGQMKRPRGGITWIRRPHVREMLRTLAAPNTPVTHETLNGMSPWRSVAYLRDLLMLHGVLIPSRVPKPAPSQAVADRVAAVQPGVVIPVGVFRGGQPAARNPPSAASSSSMSAAAVIWCTRAGESPAATR